MFAPAPITASQNGGPTTMTTRGRRRQRPSGSDSSLPLPKSKRLRSDRPQVTDQTFVEPIAAPETYEVKSAQPSVVEVKQDGIEQRVPAQRQELSVRSKKNRPGDRLHKGDGATLLSANIAIEVRKLPALPERIKLDTASRQHGFVDTSTGCALSLTHTHAVVWPYASISLSPESFTFTLPYPSKHSTDPLPLGLLVSPSASCSEPGLVVVMPTSGKITYWESISSATTLDFMRQQRTGVEDSISGMFSGERVIQLLNIEAATGFVLAFSSGRIAYLSVRDAQGRPKVSVQFLRTSLGPSSGGLFGSIRNVLSHSAVQGDIAAVRADRSSKQGECTVVAATSKGRVNSWRIHRGGHHDLLAELDVRSAVLEAVGLADQSSGACSSDSFKIVDFCFVPKGMSSMYTDMSRLRQLPASDNQQHLVLLISLDDDKHRSRYSLVEVVIHNGPSQDSQAEIGMVRSITSYSTPPDPHGLTKPRLYLPKPAVIAFLIFDRATVVASIAQPPESPDSQIMQDNHTLPAAFEDVIDLRRDPTLEIIGSGFEEPQVYDLEEDELRSVRIKTKNPTAVLLVRGAGTMRITVPDCKRFASNTPPKLTAKTKLEQAVFFGLKDDNPFVFDIQHNLRFSNKEHGAAALELSGEILASTGPHLPPLAARLVDNIKDRVRYLDKMMAHIKTIGVNLDRTVKWQLLWNAEKMHVASTLWRKHEEFLHSRPAVAKQTIVAEIVEYIRSEEKSKPDRARGETDELRHWFIHDIHRMELFIAWGYEVIKHNSKAKLDATALTRLISEASDIYNSTIRDAFAFRQTHLELYGLKGEKLNHGILENFAGLPTPWTANRFVANNVKRQVELATEWVKQDPESLTEEQTSLIEQIREILPEMTEVYLSVLQELTRWNLASGDPKLVSEGQKYDELYKEDRHTKVVLLSQSGNWEAAIKIAETHRSLPALAEVLTQEIELLREKLSDPGLSTDQIERLDARMAEKEAKVQDCFDIYGEDFAFPFYDYLFATYGVDALLEYDRDKRYKTLYLRTRPELAKISWINDIVGEEDIDHAADTLLDLGLAREQQVWNKKIELSLSKLARMAESSCLVSKASMPTIQEANISGTAEDAQLDAIDKELAIISIQNEFYDTQIRPIISVALDEAEELGLVQEAFALQVPKKHKILAQLFEDAMKRLLKHDALDPLTLIDLLTLINLPSETKENIADQFFLALQVASNGLRDDELHQAEQLIWRRCYLREDWTTINHTSMKGDEETMDVLGQTDLFQLYCTLYAHQTNRRAKMAHRRLSPMESAGVYTQTLDGRFVNMEKGYREKMLEAMGWEDSNLREQIETQRLEEWTQETQRLAEQAVDQSCDETEIQSTGSPSSTGPN